MKNAAKAGRGRSRAKVSPEYKEWMKRRKDLVATMNDARRRDLSNVKRFSRPVRRGAAK